MLQKRIQQELQAIEQQGLWRQLQTPVGLDFSSNDYLGFCRHPQLQEIILAKLTSSPILGNSASRLLRGHLPEHELLEERFAHFKNTQSALFFANGYTANLAVLTALIKPNDRVLSDAQNHASIIDALRLTQSYKIIFKHLDTAELEAHLKTPYSKGQTFIVTESLFSMDGDSAPLHTYADLAERYDAALIVDDSHGVGVYGEQRRSGLTEYYEVEQRCTAIVSTCGKALGVFGAFVNGPTWLKPYLVNCARPFIFTTAPPPYMLYAVEAALDLLAENLTLGAQALQLADTLRAHLQPLNTLQSTSLIVPVILHDNQRASKTAALLQNQGFDVRAIRPPTVAANTARLRICVHANHALEDLERLTQTLKTILEPENSST